MIILLFCLINFYSHVVLVVIKFSKCHCLVLEQYVAYLYYLRRKVRKKIINSHTEFILSINLCINLMTNILYRLHITHYVGTRLVSNKMFYVDFSTIVYLKNCRQKIGNFFIDFKYYTSSQCLFIALFKNVDHISCT